MFVDTFCLWTTYDISHPTEFHVKRSCFVVSFLLFNYVFKLFWTKVFLPWYFIHERRNKIVLSAVPRFVCLRLSVCRGLGTRRDFERLDGKNHTFKKLFQVLYFCTFKPTNSFIKVDVVRLSPTCGLLQAAMRRWWGGWWCWCGRGWWAWRGRGAGRGSPPGWRRSPTRTGTQRSSPATSGEWRHPLQFTPQSAVTFSSLSPSSPGDRVTLLLWYKETTAAAGAEQGAGRPGGMGSPIYRIDARTNNKDIAIGEMIGNSISLASDCYIL